MMFNDTPNLVINGGTLTNVGGDFHRYNIQGNLLYGDGEIGLQSLGRAASLGAIHDSSERYPPPSCHAETRLEVRRLMLDWAEDPDTSSLMLWLYGSAGVGKSAIMQSIAEQLALREGSLGASFFFSAGKPDRNQGKFLFSTIAYQLALSIPELRPHINNAMLCNPTLHTKAINVQMRHLIIEPFGKLASSLEVVPTILVDGLDECENHEIQRFIITLIGEALVTYKLPIRFVIASRPEPHIREAFDTTQLSGTTHRIPLDQSFQASRDIKKYLEDGFEEIYHKNPQVMTQVEKPWPGHSIVDLLVQKASGQFIYAATVLKFVGAEYYRPTSQLAIVLEPRPSSSVKPFADLDHLYHQILSSHNDTTTLVRVLGTLLTLEGWQPPEVIEDILSMEPGDLSLILRGLHSVIDIPQSQVDSYTDNGQSDEERGLRLFHASFREYLVDHDRSGPFFVDIDRFCVEVAFLVFELVGKGISQSRRGECHQSLRPWTWVYLVQYIYLHFEQCSLEDRHRMLDLLRLHIEGLWNSDTILQIHLLSLHRAMRSIEGVIYHHRVRDRRYNLPFDSWDILVDHRYPTDRIEQRHREGIDPLLDQKLIETYKVLRTVLDRRYHLMLSTSSDLTDFLRSVPGFIAIVNPLPISKWADILNVDAELLQSYLERNQCFMYSKNSATALDQHVFDYLSNQRRSDDQYHDLLPDHIFLCMRALSVSFQCHWAQPERCNRETREFFDREFRSLLFKISVLPTDNSDHPLWAFVDYLAQLVYYHPGLQDADTIIPWRETWSYTSAILTWVQNQQQRIKKINTSLHLDYEQKLDDIVDRIYQQIICVESALEGPAITFHPPLLVAIKKANSISSLSSLVPPRIPAISQYTGDITKPLGLSFDILSVEHINPSLEKYLTCPTRAREIYISKDHFHTQLAEMWLDRLSDEAMNSSFIPGHGYLMAHLVCANETEKIFARLRVHIPRSFSGFESPAQLCQEIIDWLESIDKPPLDVYLRYQLMLLDAEADEIERKIADQERTIPSEPVHIQKMFQPDARPITDATSSPILPIGKSSWKRVLEGIGDGYLRLTLVMFHYLSLIFYWHRRYLA